VGTFLDDRETWELFSIPFFQPLQVPIDKKKNILLLILHISAIVKLESEVGEGS